jgi:hypothetical protein
MLWYKTPLTNYRFKSAVCCKQHIKINNSSNPFLTIIVFEFSWRGFSRQTFFYKILLVPTDDVLILKQQGAGIDSAAPLLSGVTSCPGQNT